MVKLYKVMDQRIMTSLTDDTGDPRRLPCYKNIITVIRNIKNLVLNLKQHIVTERSVHVHT